MSVVNDWGCRVCGRVRRNVHLPSGTAPRCCGRDMVCRWDHGRAPATDLGKPEYNHATGQIHRSSREAELCLAEQTRRWGERFGAFWETPIAAGDRVHGARNETGRSHAAFGYAGQRSRRSMGEERREPAPPTPRPRPQPPEPRPDPHGLRPRRLSREQAEKERASRIYPGVS